MATKPTTTLIAIPQLFTEAWELTKNRFWQMLGLLLLQGLIFTIVIGGVLLALLAGSLGTLAKSQLFNNPELTMEQIVQSPTLGPIMNALMITVFVALAVALVIGPIFQAAIIALAGSNKKTSIKEALGVGWKKFVPVLGAGLIIGLLVLGGAALFIIPGIIFGLLLTFAIYEIVLHDAKLVSALKTSAGMVWEYFWPVVGRMALLSLIGMVISAVGDSWREMNQPIFSLVKMALDLGFSIFSVMYSMVLYKNLRAVASKKKLELTPIIALSILGWLVIAIIARNLANII